MSATLKTRYHVLDALRGLALINMIAYHFLWDMIYLFGLSAPWYAAAPGRIWQQCICWTFISLSGLCARMGRNRLRRGLLVLGCSVVVSAVTLIFMPGSRILFGVLCLIGSCALLTLPLEKILSKVTPWLGALISFVLFLLVKDVPSGTLAFGTVTLPDWLYANLLTAYLGFPAPTFWSSDYFPLIPWLFLYLTGYFLFPYLGRCQFLTARPAKPLEFLGRHSLIIYMAHQPVCYALSWLLAYFF